ncbi:hypothetical protein [Pseudomonas sp. NFR16]|uniref:hypothetical protein n=1 Tax=Pseudomonas sp. NFR16 TaxID=1566248 RepID=UPI0011600EF6
MSKLSFATKAGRKKMPDFHEVKPPSRHLYKEGGKDGQKIAGRASEEMTESSQGMTQRSYGRTLFQTSVSAKSLDSLARVLRRPKMKKGIKPVSG